MLERLNPVLKAACCILALVILFELLTITRRKNPLDHFIPPPLPIAKSELKVEPKSTPANVTSMPGTMRPGLARMGRPTSADDLPAPVKARVDRIVESEIFGPVAHPLPMALLGIAGRDAFLRAPNGQTGVIREGEELGGIKLLKIGTNRVLVEHEKQQKELTLFAGFGSESLLPKEKDNPIENTTKPKN